MCLYFEDGTDLVDAVLLSGKSLSDYSYFSSNVGSGNITSVSSYPSVFCYKMLYVSHAPSTSSSPSSSRVPSTTVAYSPTASIAPSTSHSPSVTVTASPDYGGFDFVGEGYCQAPNYKSYDGIFLNYGTPVTKNECAQYGGNFTLIPGFRGFQYDSFYSPTANSTCYMLFDD